MPSTTAPSSVGSSGSEGGMTKSMQGNGREGIGEILDVHVGVVRSDSCVRVLDADRQDPMGVATGEPFGPRLTASGMKLRLGDCVVHLCSKTFTFSATLPRSGSSFCSVTGVPMALGTPQCDSRCAEGTSEFDTCSSRSALNILPSPAGQHKRCDVEDSLALGRANSWRLAASSTTFSATCASGGSGKLSDGLL